MELHPLVQPPVKARVVHVVLIIWGAGLEPPLNHLGFVHLLAPPRTRHDCANGKREHNLGEGGGPPSLAVGTPSGGSIGNPWGWQGAGGGRRRRGTLATSQVSIPFSATAGTFGGPWRAAGAPHPTAVRIAPISATASAATTPSCTVSIIGVIAARAHAQRALRTALPPQPAATAAAAAGRSGGRRAADRPRPPTAASFARGGGATGDGGGGNRRRSRPRCNTGSPSSAATIIFLVIICRAAPSRPAACAASAASSGRLRCRWAGYRACASPAQLAAPALAVTRRVRVVGIIAIVVVHVHGIRGPVGRAATAGTAAAPASTAAAAAGTAAGGLTFFLLLLFPLLLIVVLVHHVAPSIIVPRSFRLLFLFFLLLFLLLGHHL